MAQNSPKERLKLKGSLKQSDGKTGITSDSVLTQKLREMFAKDEDTQDTSTLTKVVGLKNIDGYLSPSSQILPSDQMADTRNAHVECQHWVVHTNGIYFKVEDLQSPALSVIRPGIEAAVVRLSTIMDAGISPASILLKMTKEGRDFCVIASLRIPYSQPLTGATRDELANINMDSFFNAFVMTLLSCPTDGKPANYLLSKGDVFSVDHDLDFYPLFASGTIHLRSFLLLLPTMEKEISSHLLDKIAGLNPFDVIHRWLLSLEAKNKEFNRYLEEKHFSEEEYSELLLPIALNDFIVDHIYQTLLNLQRGIRLFRERNESITCWKLFEFVLPQLALVYRRASAEEDPAKAFASLDDCLASLMKEDDNFELKSHLMWKDKSVDYYLNKRTKSPKELLVRFVSHYYSDQKPDRLLKSMVSGASLHGISDEHALKDALEAIKEDIELTFVECPGANDNFLELAEEIEKVKMVMVACDGITTDGIVKSLNFRENLQLIPDHSFHFIPDSDESTLMMLANEWTHYRLRNPLSGTDDFLTCPATKEKFKDYDITPYSGEDVSTWLKEATRAANIFIERSRYAQHFMTLPFAVRVKLLCEQAKLTEGIPILKELLSRSFSSYRQPLESEVRNLAMVLIQDIEVDLQEWHNVHAADGLTEFKFPLLVRQRNGHRLVSKREDIQFPTSVASPLSPHKVIAKLESVKFKLLYLVQSLLKLSREDGGNKNVQSSPIVNNPRGTVNSLVEEANQALAILEDNGQVDPNYVAALCRVLVERSVDIASVQLQALKLVTSDVGLSKYADQILIHLSKLSTKSMLDVGDCGEISFCQIATKIFERLTGYRPIRGASIEDLLNYRVLQYLRDIAVTAGIRQRPAEEMMEIIYLLVDTDNQHRKSNGKRRKPDKREQPYRFCANSVVAHPFVLAFSEMLMEFTSYQKITTILETMKLKPAFSEAAWRAQTMFGIGISLRFKSFLQILSADDVDNSVAKTISVLQDALRHDETQGKLATLVDDAIERVQALDQRCSEMHHKGVKLNVTYSRLKDIFVSLEARLVNLKEALYDSPVIANGIFCGEVLLRPSFANLFSAKHKGLAATEHYGVRNVTHAEGIHWKQNPEMPGFEQAVNSLNQLLLGSSSLQIEFFAVTHHGQQTFVQASRTIKGVNLRDFLKINKFLAKFKLSGKSWEEWSITTDQKELAEIEELCRRYVGRDCQLPIEQFRQQYPHVDLPIEKLVIDKYSEQMLMTILTCPADGKADNYILEEYSEGRFQIVCVDNDHSFQNPISELCNPVFDGRQITKTILWCFDAMKDRIDPVARLKFMTINVHSLVSLWLRQLKWYNTKCTYRFKASGIIRYWKDFKVGIPVILTKEIVLGVYFNLEKMQEELKNKDINHISIVWKVQQDVAANFVRYISTPAHPLERWRAVTKKEYERLNLKAENFFMSLFFGKTTLYKERSLTTALDVYTKMLKVPSWNSTSDMKELIKNNSPAVMLQLLKALKHQKRSLNQQLNEVKELMKVGIEKAFKRITEIPFSRNQQYIINQLDWFSLDQTSTETLLRKTRELKFIRKLVIQNSLHFASLSHILLDKHAGKLQYLDISGCKAITSVDIKKIIEKCGNLRVLIARNITTLVIVNQKGDPSKKGKLKSKSLERLDLKGCHQLVKIEMDCPNLEELYLDGCSGLVDIDLTADELQRVSLNGCTNVDIRGLTSSGKGEMFEIKRLLAKLKLEENQDLKWNLKELRMEGTKPTPDDLERIADVSTPDMLLSGLSTEDALIYASKCRSMTALALQVLFNMHHLDNLAYLLQNNGLLHLSLPLYLELPITSSNLHNTGSIFVVMGNFNASIKSFETALILNRSRSTLAEYALVLLAAGTVKKDQNLLDKARQVASECIRHGEDRSGLSCTSVDSHFVMLPEIKGAFELEGVMEGAIGSISIVPHHLAYRILTTLTTDEEERKAIAAQFAAEVRSLIARMDEIVKRSQEEVTVERKDSENEFEYQMRKRNMGVMYKMLVFVSDDLKDLLRTFQPSSIFLLSAALGGNIEEDFVRTLAQATQAIHELALANARCNLAFLQMQREDPDGELADAKVMLTNQLKRGF
jgi:hypothetical protein